MSSDISKSDFNYPVPVMSYSEEPDDVTIGVFKGELSGHRPFVADVWWWENFVGVTYRFSKIGLENATEDDIAAILVESRQIKTLNSETRKQISGLCDLKDNAGNDIWNISIHLGIADRITLRDSDGVICTFISSEITDTDGGPPPMTKILEPSADSLIMALIVIQVLDKMPPQEREELFKSLSNEFQEYIQTIRKGSKGK